MASDSLSEARPRPNTTGRTEEEENGQRDDGHDATVEDGGIVDVEVQETMNGMLQKIQNYENVMMAINAIEKKVKTAISEKEYVDAGSHRVRKLFVIPPIINPPSSSSPSSVVSPNID